MSEFIDLLAAVSKRGVWVEGLVQDDDTITLSAPLECSLPEDDPVLLRLRSYKPEIWDLVARRDECTDRREGDSGNPHDIGTYYPSS